MTGSSDNRSTLTVGQRSYDYWSFARLPQDKVARLPYSLKILLENLLRYEDGVNVTRGRHRGAAELGPEGRRPTYEIAFMPARVMLQDFTGVPCVVDLAAMRDAVQKLGGNPEQINPLIPPNWSSTTRCRSTSTARAELAGDERQDRIRAQRRALRVPALGPDGVPQLQGGAAEHRHRAPGESRVPGRVVFRQRHDGKQPGVPGHRGRHRLAHHDDQRPRRARLGRGRHRGRGGDARPAGHDAHSAGRRLQADRQAAAPARPRPTWCSPSPRCCARRAWSDKFVEFFGDGLANLPLADRATIANMAPEYGSTCGIFPIDDETLRLPATVGPQRGQIALVEAYAKAQGLWRANGAKPADYTDVLELDLAHGRASRSPGRSVRRIACR